MRVSTATHERISRLAHARGKSMATVVTEAIDDYERKSFFEELSTQIAATRADPAAWAEVEAEQAEWDGTLTDGIDEEGDWADRTTR
jgi:predicted transcriptional regulator